MFSVRKVVWSLYSIRGNSTRLYMYIAICPVMYFCLSAVAIRFVSVNILSRLGVKILFFETQIPRILTGVFGGWAVIISLFIRIVFGLVVLIAISLVLELFALISLSWKKEVDLSSRYCKFCCDCASKFRSSMKASALVKFVYV